MAGLDPTEYVNKMKFTAARLLERHMNPPPFEETWNNFVGSANKWLTEQGLKEYDKIDLANMRGGSNPTDKILSDLGHKGCRVVDLVGILQKAEMYDILEADEFKLLPERELPSKAGKSKAPVKRQMSLPQEATRLYQTNSRSNKTIRRRHTMPEEIEEDDAYDIGEDEEEYATASSGEDEGEDVSNQKGVNLVTTKPVHRKRPSSAQRALQSKKIRGNPAGPAELVLDRFRDQFIADMDANSIVMELEHRGIISNGDRRAIREELDASQQNQLLHARLKKKCTVKALMDVCDIITEVNGNPKMTSLGEDMKMELEKGS